MDQILKRFIVKYCHVVICSVIIEAFWIDDRIYYIL
jgi:hypothetical protein